MSDVQRKFKNNTKHQRTSLEAVANIGDSPAWYKDGVPEEESRTKRDADDLKRHVTKEHAQVSQLARMRHKYCLYSH